jgi:hypothetical protein
MESPWIDLLAVAQPAGRAAEIGWAVAMRAASRACDCVLETRAPLEDLRARAKRSDNSDHLQTYLRRAEEYVAQAADHAQRAAERVALARLGSMADASDAALEAVQTARKAAVARNVWRGGNTSDAPAHAAHAEALAQRADLLELLAKVS